MKYEIVNIHDKCFITSDDEQVAKFCTILLGQGMYFLKREDGEQVEGTFLLYSEEGALDAEFGGDFEKFGKEHAAQIAACFKTFEYAGEPTSMTNIGASAERYAKAYEKLAGGAK